MPAAAGPSSAELVVGLCTQCEDNAADLALEPCDDADANLTRLDSAALSTLQYVLGEAAIPGRSATQYLPLQARAPPRLFS